MIPHFELSPNVSETPEAKIVTFKSRKNKAVGYEVSIQIVLHKQQEESRDEEADR